MSNDNFIKLYEESFKNNWELPCYSDYGENNTRTYGQVAEEIAKLHLIFKHCSLRRGDKIALIGNSKTRFGNEKYPNSRVSVAFEKLAKVHILSSL